MLDFRRAFVVAWLAIASPRHRGDDGTEVVMGSQGGLSSTTVRLSALAALQLFVAAVILVLGAAPASAVQIRACVSKSSGEVKILAPHGSGNTPCKASENLVV